MNKQILAVFLLGIGARVGASTNELPWRVVAGSDAIVVGNMEIPTGVLDQAAEAAPESFLGSQKWYVRIHIVDARILKGPETEPLAPYYFAGTSRVFRAYHPQLPNAQEMKTLAGERVLLCMNRSHSMAQSLAPTGFHINEILKWSPELQSNVLALVKSQATVIDSLSIPNDSNADRVRMILDRIASGDGDPHPWIEIQQIGVAALPSVISLLKDKRAPHPRFRYVLLKGGHDQRVGIGGAADMSYGLSWVLQDITEDEGPRWLGDFNKSSDYWRLYWYYEVREKEIQNQTSEGIRHPVDGSPKHSR